MPDKQDNRGDSMNQASEAQAQQQLVETPEARYLLHWRALRRATIALGLVAALGLFLVWLPLSSRRLLIGSLFANRLLIALLGVFGLIVVSLLWAVGQRLDVWLFTAMNLRGYHAIWMDRPMWLATQIGNVGFAALLVAAS
jgi:hypothetical protein